MSQQKTIFDKIVAKEIPANIVYEDELCMAFRDVNPQAPVHLVLIPKVMSGLSQLSKAQENNKEILGHLMWAAAQAANKAGLKDGWRLVINDGPHGCQSIYYLHIHILGGEQLSWPPGTKGPGGEY